VHSIQDQAQAAGHQLKAAAAEATRVVTGEVAKPQKPKHRGLLIFGVIAAAVAAGVAAWKASKPVEDPWKTPAPVTPAPVNDVTAAAKDAAATAGEKTVDAADAAADASDDAAEKAGDAVEDAKDEAAKVATDAKTAVKNIASSMNNGAAKATEK